MQEKLSRLDIGVLKSIFSLRVLLRTRHIETQGDNIVSKNKVGAFLNRAGLQVDGPNEFDPKVTSDEFYRMVTLKGMLGLGESYVLGHWDCEDLEVFFLRAFRSGLLEELANALPMKIMRFMYGVSNPQSVIRAKHNAQDHYAKQEAVVLSMTGRRKAYTCARWTDPLDPNEVDIDIAQERKLQLIYNKLCLNPGKKTLDIGCGWGSLIGFLAERGVDSYGITPVDSQIEYIRNAYGGTVKVAVSDYRDRPADWNLFDAVVSVGMYEHVGRKNADAYMHAVNNMLAPESLALTHCFGIANSKVPLVDPWTEKYIFPGVYLPTLSEIVQASENADLRVVDVEEMGIHYQKTLRSWNKNFVEAWPMLKQNQSFNPCFFRMWRYYLLIAAAAFGARKIDLWQIIHQPIVSTRYYKRT